MRRSLGWIMVLALAGVGCSGACDELAASLRECCARGPEELRASCEATAAELENDGNADACQAELDRDVYARCEP